METILVPFNLSNKRINHFIIFAYCHFFSFLFFVPCNFVHDLHVGIFAMPMVFSPIFCLDHPFGFST